MGTSKNLGGVDRVARITIGLVLLSLIAFAFVGPKTPLAYLGLAGVMPLVAGITGYCPPYKLLGINTYRGQQRTHNPSEV
jgi:hypothetical protein